MGSTTIFTVVVTKSRTYIALPHTLSVQKRKGSGNLFSESSKTIFFREWQEQLQAIFELVKTLFSPEGWDFYVSVDCEAVEGSSASIPLFLLFASSITGEQLPENVFSTGSMFSPNGFLGYGHPESLEAKVKALEHLISYAPVENPQFLVPFPFDEYTSETVQCVQVTTVFSALRATLPKTFQSCNSVIDKLSHVTSVISGRVLEYIPPTGDVFVIDSPDTDAPYQVTDCEGTPVVVEELPPDISPYVYYIKNNRVVLVHQYVNTEVALEKVSLYKKLENSVKCSVIF